MVTGLDGFFGRRPERSPQAVPTGSSTPWRAPGPTGRQPWRRGTSLALWRRFWVRRETHEEDQWSPTGPAAPFLRGGWPCLLTVPEGDALRSRGVAEAGRQERADLREHLATARAQDAGVSDCDAPPGQHRLEEAVDARFGGARQPFPPGAGVLLDAERDRPIFQHFQAVGGEGKPGEVRSEGGEDRRAGARRLAVGHPVLVPDLGRHEIAEASGSQCRFARAPEERGECADGHEPGRRAGGEPL